MYAPVEGTVPATHAVGPRPPRDPPPPPYSLDETPIRGPRPDEKKGRKGQKTGKSSAVWRGSNERSNDVLLSTLNGTISLLPLRDQCFIARSACRLAGFAEPVPLERSSKMAGGASTSKPMRESLPPVPVAATAKEAAAAPRARNEATARKPKAWEMPVVCELESAHLIAQVPPKDRGTSAVFVENQSKLAASQSALSRYIQGISRAPGQAREYSVEGLVRLLNACSVDETRCLFHGPDCTIVVKLDTIDYYDIIISITNVYVSRKGDVTQEVPSLGVAPCTRCASGSDRAMVQFSAFAKMSELEEFDRPTASSSSSSAGGGGGGEPSSKKRKLEVDGNLVIVGTSEI